MRKWGSRHRLRRGGEDRYAPILVGARMTKDGHPYLGRGLKFKVESLFGTDERLARPRMTRDGHPYLGRAESFKVGSLVRTSILHVLG